MWYGHAVALAALVAAGVASAQGDTPPTPTDPGAKACRADAVRLCHDAVAAHDRAGAIACLVKNLDRASPDCRAVIAAHLNRSPPARPG